MQTVVIVVQMVVRAIVQTVTEKCMAMVAQNAPEQKNNFK
jgi:hypothetical protein